MNKILIDPQPKHKLSPYLYSQFMEPLGTADSSVDAAWNFLEERWHSDLIETVKYLSPPLVRWGGCFASYYHWKEAVGARANRVPMLNLCWDGIYHNQVGTAEVVDFSRQINSELLFTVNLESDGRKYWARPKTGMDRLGTAQEAAEWVDYCNNPDNRLRQVHGSVDPYNVRHWMLGNETSYDKNGFNCEQTCEVTKRFAAEMRKSDPSIKLIAWGDDGWADPMCQAAGDLIDYLSFHHHFIFWDDDSPLFSLNYRKDFEKTWDCLLGIHDDLQNHIDKVRGEVTPYGKRIAMTEGHFNIGSRNRGEVLSSWAAGVAYARCLNVLERNGDILDIGMMADFFGNRWQVNAIMIPTPHNDRRRPYLQPVGWAMSLFGKHRGEDAVSVNAFDGLDVTASRTGNRFFLHAVNTSATSAVNASIEIEGLKVKQGTATYIAADPQLEITEFEPDLFMPESKPLCGSQWSFPPASITVLEFECS